MNLDDSIFQCPTCCDSQQVRVPALHGYKPCPDCTMPKPSRCCAAKRETPTPFDKITPEMLAGAGRSMEPSARYEMRCRWCGCVAYTGPESNPDLALGTDRGLKFCWSCGNPLEHITVTRLHPPTLRDITAAELEKMGLRLQVSQPEPPPTGNGELVTPPLLAAIKDHPDLHALVVARDVFGRSKYGTGLRCHNGRDPLEDARQELGDLLQYLWQALMEGRDISNQLDMMARAITVLQGAKR